MYYAGDVMEVVLAVLLLRAWYRRSGRALRPAPTEPALRLAPTDPALRLAPTEPARTEAVPGA
jgi:hypothetical protein